MLTTTPLRMTTVILLSFPSRVLSVFVEHSYSRALLIYEPSEAEQLSFRSQEVTPRQACDKSIWVRLSRMNGEFVLTLLSPGVCVTNARRISAATITLRLDSFLHGH